MTDALLTFRGAEGFRPVVVTGFKLHGDLVQVAEASLALVGTDEAEILLALCLGERVEDVMDLWGETMGSEEAALSSPAQCPTVGCPGTPAYVDPDVRDLFINDEGLRVLGDSSGSHLPLHLSLGRRDEEGGGQEDKLEPLLRTVQEHGPGAGRERGKAAGGLRLAGDSRRRPQGSSLLKSAHGHSGCGH